MIPAFAPASDFVPTNLDATRWDSLKPLYQALIDRDLHCKNCLERLILDRSELDATASEAGTMLHIRMTCHTDDGAAQKAYLDFITTVVPRLKEVGFELDKKIVTSPHVKDLDQKRYEVLLRDLKANVDLFRPENVPIETEIDKLQQEFSQIAGAMTVTFRGEEKTLPQMGKYQEETERATREAAYRAVADRRLKDRAALDALYDKMIAKRHQVAQNAGFKNFRDYAFKARRRFDYTAEDCHKFAEGVEKHVVPALRTLLQERKRALGVSTLRPWDLAVDPKGRPPLKPFENGDDLFQKSARLFARMDPSLGELFQSLRSGGCLDLDSRKGKAPGGYQATRDRQRMPFIFMNAASLQRDVETMVHEAGHAFHALLDRADPLLAYRSEVPIEFCEVASMTMELTSHPFLDEFYKPGEVERARRKHLEGIATILPWIATIDQFQHWVYLNPSHSHAERTKAWNGLLARFYPEVDFNGIEPYRDAMWQRQGHLFTSAFYYIEYGIAQLGALQLYANYRREPAKAIAEYKHALTLGGSRPLPELFRAAGLAFDFSPSRIQQTWKQVERDLDELPV